MKEIHTHGDIDRRLVGFQKTRHHIMYHLLHIAIVALNIYSVLFTIETQCEFAVCLASIPLFFIILPFSVTYLFGLFVKDQYWKTLAIIIFIEGLLIGCALIWGATYLFEMIRHN